MRALFQVLVIPYRRTKSGFEFAILKRSDTKYWQFIAGGGEDNETPVHAAERETKEEIGIEVTGQLLRLNSIAAIPRDSFAGSDSWGPEVNEIPEHAFAIDAGNNQIKLSNEHTEYRWVNYNEAYTLLYWDSNRNALQKLNEWLNQTGS